MDSVVEIDISGIRCDAKDCDYESEDVDPSDYIDWLNKPCPDCGANLLTQQDYDLTMLLVAVAKVLSDGIPVSEQGPVVNIELSMDGSGLDGLKVGRTSVESD